MKTRKTEFMVVISSKAENLAMELGELANHGGWTPVGGIAIAPGFSGTVFAQLVLRKV